MANCSNCGKAVEDKTKVCPFCGKPARLNSPGMFGGGGLEYLIAVVLCGGVLAAILLPVFASAKTAARRTLVLSQGKGVATAMAGYLADHDDRYPPMESNIAVEQRLDRYMKEPDDLRLRECAMTGTWNRAIAGLATSNIENFGEIWLFYSERESDPGFGAIVYLDTRVTSANKFVFENAMAKKLVIDKSVK